MRLGQILIHTLASLYLGLTALASAHASPKDLQKILAKWEEITKTDAASKLIQLEAVQLPLDSQSPASELLKRELSRHASALESHLRDLQFVTLAEDARKDILKALFPSKQTNLAFCKAFPSKPIKLGEDEQKTEEELRQLQNKSDYLHCRKIVQETLGGILHADPLSYLFEVSKTDASQAGQGLVVFYVSSLIEPEQALRFQFSL